MVPPSKPKRVALYLRVSTSGQTVENQRQDLHRVAEQRGWQIVGEYVDHGISGAKGREKRPQLDQLCRDVTQGRIDLVAAWAIDRVGRSLPQLAQFIEDLQAQRVGLYLHQQQIDSSTAAGKAFLQMAGVFAEFERSIILERIHAGLSRARSQGKTLGRPAVGGRVEGQIRKLAAEGVGKVKIAKQLGCGVSTVQRVLAAA